MYDTQTVLTSIDANVVPVLVLCALSLVGNYIYWIQNLLIGFKYKIHTMPIGCLFFFLSHDATYVAMYSKWFHEINHWFPKLFWFGLCLTVMMELAFFVMILKFARKEVMPEVSQRLFTLSMLGGLVAVFVAWMVVKITMDDELFLIIFGVTIFWCSPFTFAMMASRKSALGQPVSAWVGYLIMPLTYWPALAMLDPFFRSPLWVGFGCLIVLFGLINICYIVKLKEQTQRHRQSIANGVV